jgi:hypothetical protein
MDEQLSQQKRQSRTYRKWYESNGEQHNRSRQERYANDPDYREKVKEQSRRSRERRKERGGVQETTVTRIRNGVEIEMYRVSAAADIVGKSADTIRSWARHGWIPDDGVEAHRLYELHQVMLMQRLNETIKKYRYAKDYYVQLGKCVAYIAAKW